MEKTTMIIDIYLYGLVMSFIFSWFIETAKLLISDNIRNEFWKTCKIIILLTVLSWVGLTWEIGNLFYKNIKNGKL